MRCRQEAKAAQRLLCSILPPDTLPSCQLSSDQEYEQAVLATYPADRPAQLQVTRAVCVHGVYAGFEMSFLGTAWGNVMHNGLQVVPQMYFSTVLSGPTFPQLQVNGCVSQGLAPDSEWLQGSACSGA